MSILVNFLTNLLDNFILRTLLYILTWTIKQQSPKKLLAVETDFFAYFTFHICEYEVRF